MEVQKYLFGIIYGIGQVLSINLVSNTSNYNQ